MAIVYLMVTFFPSCIIEWVLNEKLREICTSSHVWTFERLLHRSVYRRPDMSQVSGTTPQQTVPAQETNNTALRKCLQLAGH
jgi:hypothetical protein